MQNFRLIFFILPAHFLSHWNKILFGAFLFILWFFSRFIKYFILSLKKNIKSFFAELSKIGQIFSDFLLSKNWLSATCSDFFDITVMIKLSLSLSLKIAQKMTTWRRDRKDSLLFIVSVGSVFYAARALVNEGNIVYFGIFLSTQKAIFVLLFFKKDNKVDFTTRTLPSSPSVINQYLRRFRSSHLAN